MSLSNINTEKQKSKQLNSIELGQIEAYLNKGLSPVEIGKNLDRDPSGIRKEIKNYTIITKPSKRSCMGCGNYIQCKKKNLCTETKGKGCPPRCNQCGIAVDVCEEYTNEPACKYLSGRRKVCNGCEYINICKQPKKLYKANEAEKEHKDNRQNSVKQYKALGDIKYLAEISRRVMLGQSPAVILATVKGETNISVPTVYSYIDKGFMECKNIDLRDKVKRKPKKEKRETKESRSKHRANGRSYHDLPEVARTREEFGRTEMDTVEGIKGGKLLLTFIIKKPSFLLGIPIKNKKQDDVKKEIDKLERKLGADFEKIFKTIVTDNGVEFVDYEKIENSVRHKGMRTAVNYADPYSSSQKGQLENQHRLIRYFFPKGKDFGKYTDMGIKEKINRINNYPRKALNYSTPYQEMKKIVGAKVLEKLGFHEIPIEELNMTIKKAA